MPTIRFSHDWNNKVTGHNELFTTVRGRTPEKWIYYCDRIGKIFDVVLKKKKICGAELLVVRGDRLNEIPLPLLIIDTGIDNIADINKLFVKFKIPENGEVMVLVFKKVIWYADGA